MIQKTYEILEGTLALIALVAIVGISTFSVIALNPNSSPAVAQQNVAGAFTSVQELPSTDFEIKNLRESDENYRTNLVFLGEGKGYVYTANFKSGAAISTNKFIEVSNLNNFDAALSIETELSGAIQDSIEINVNDSSDKVLLYSPQRGVNNIKLTIPANTKRTFNIEYTFLKNVNFGFEVKIKLN